ncbi:uracil-DNA glycosylase [Tropicimonas sp.]|uniref:uracil-DNA glycosylase n=1 Tax=Tropicimonas sp. TaxID=2067044 RepID=UPI003A8C6CBA
MADRDLHAEILAALEFQAALGADEAILDAPADRYALAAAGAEQKKREQAAPEPAGHGGGYARPAVPAPAPQPGIDPIAEARALARAAASLDDLQAALAGFERCELKMAARSLVFSDGRPEARVMIVGEAPGRDEDIRGRPFVGRAGQLLDRMFAAIGLSRDAPDAETALYISNILPWRPPQNRDPRPEEIAMMRPFVERHIELAAPDVLVLMGNISCQAMLGRRGITRLRGHWAEVQGRPAIPMFHPAYLLRNPVAKREAWADLLDIRKRLRR